MVHLLPRDLFNAKAVNMPSDANASGVSFKILSISVLDLTRIIALDQNVASVMCKKRSAKKPEDMDKTLKRATTKKPEYIRPHHSE